MLTPGPTIDLDFIEKDILEFASKYNIVKIYSDPYNAERLASNLVDAGLPIEFLAQIWSNLSDSTKTVLELVLSGRLRHGGHAILRWMASNAIAKIDKRKCEARQEQEQAKNRWNDALVNAVAAAIRTPAAEESVYSKPGQLLL